MNFFLHCTLSFHNTVLAVRRATDYSQNGRWLVKWRDEKGDEREEEFETVLLAQGHHAKPKMATFKGQEQFLGNIIHSHDYKDSKGYEVRPNF